MTPEPQLFDLAKHIDRLTKEPHPKQPEGEKALSKSARTPPKFHRILVGYDGTEGSQDAFMWAQRIAIIHGSSVAPIMVLPPTPQVWGGALTGISVATQARINALLDDEEKEAATILKKATDHLKQTETPGEGVILKGKTADEIVAHAKSRNADLIVVGSHRRRGLERMLLGSVSDVVKDRADTNVLIARHAPPVHTIVLAVDGSPLSYRAAHVLEGLLSSLDADIHIVHVLPLPLANPSPSAQFMMRDLLEEIHDSLMDRLGHDSEQVRYEVLFGKPADRLLEYAREVDADLIVMGARGLSKAKGILMGSVSNRVAHQATASVLLVRDPRSDPTKEATK